MMRQFYAAEYSIFDIEDRQTHSFSISKMMEALHIGDGARFHTCYTEPTCMHVGGCISHSHTKMYIPI